MRFMVIVKATEDSEAGRMPTEELLTAMMKYNEELVKAVAGYWIWQVRSLEEAIEWVKRCPNPMFGPSDIEIRPLYDIEDFGDIVTPEVIEQEKRLREATEKLAKK